MSKISFASVLLCLCIVSALPLAAEQSGRECINFATPGQGWRIYPGSGWQTLGHMNFSFNSNSDIIAQVSAMFSETNTPDVLVSYQIWLDGAATSWTIDRLPGTFPATHVVRTIIPDVAAGVHTLSLKVENLGSVPVDYNGFWFGPTLVDASESTTVDQTSTPITIGTSWTTVDQASLSVTSSQMIMMQGYAEQHTGTAGQGIEYRFQAGSKTLQTYSDTLANQVPDGQVVSYIYAAPPSGTNTIQLQAHTISGTAQIQSRHLWLQTMPRYTVLDGTFTAASIPNNGTFTALATSPAVSMNSLSLAGISAAGGRKYTTPFGYGLLTYGSGTGSSEVTLKMEFLENGTPLGFDIGQLDQPYWGVQKLQTLMSNGDGKLGFLPPPATYSVRFSAEGLCLGAPAVPVQAGGRFQVAISPDNFPYLENHCDQHPELQCCASFPAQCTYECAADQMPVASTQRGCYGF